jgi:hypothetical protein
MSSNLYNNLMRSNSFDGVMRAAAAIVALTAAMSLRIAAAENLQDEYARIADWRAKRLASLTSETGWLTPIALYWLKDGENSFGRASDRAFSVDDAALAADTGAFVLTDGRVRYVAHTSKAMTYLGKPLTSLDLVSDVDEKPMELVAGSLHFMLIERAGHLGIRVRDSVSPNRLQFKGLQYFPFRADWHIQAHFEPYVPERRIPIVNILGMTEEMTSPGAIVFEREGRGASAACYPQMHQNLIDLAIFVSQYIALSDEVRSTGSRIVIVGLFSTRGAPLHRGFQCSARSRA